MINIIKKARDPTNSTIQLCRIGLTNSQTTKTLINSISSNFASNALSNNRRKKRSASLTCTQLNQMTSSLNSLTVNQLLSISNADFISCQILLGSSTNAWSSAQLNALATVAKSVNILIDFKIIILIIKYFRLIQQLQVYLIII